MKNIIYIILFLLIALTELKAQNFSVTNVRVEQRGDGSFFVDVFYALSLVTSNATVTMQASSDNGNTWGLNCNNVTGAVGAGITAGSNKQIIWNFGAEHTNFYNEQIKVKIIADDGITPCPGTPTIFYEGKTYNTVLIGSQCWLRENLNVGSRIDGSLNQSNNSIIEKYCYNNLELNCERYGGLYQWNETMQYVTTQGSKGICPEGWHIPTLVELETLRNSVGNNSSGLKAVGQGSGIGAGTNVSGFSALLGGSRYTLGNNYFFNLGFYFGYWSSTSVGQTSSYSFSVNESDNGIYIDYGGGFNTGISVRCLKD